MTTKEEKFWQLCLEGFSKDLTKQQLNTWIKPLEFEIQGKKTQIIAPNQFILQWSYFDDENIGSRRFWVNATDGDVHSAKRWL